MAQRSTSSVGHLPLSKVTQVKESSKMFFLLTEMKTRRIHFPHSPSRHTRSRAHRTIRHRTMGNRPPLPARPHFLFHVAQRRTPSNRLWRSRSGEGLVRESAERRRVCDPCHFERRLELSRCGFRRGIEDVQEGDGAHVACCTPSSLFFLQLQVTYYSVDERFGNNKLSNHPTSTQLTSTVRPLPASLLTLIPPTIRPADIRGALNALTITSLLAQRAKLKSKSTTDPSQPPPAKRAKTNGSPVKPKPTTTKSSKGKEKAKPQNRKTKGEDQEEEEGGAEETYHFIGYVPAFGKVWELDGLKSGPLEVGELPICHDQPPQASSSSSQPQPQQPQSPVGWMSTVRPALRLKMSKYGASPTESSSNIRFSLLAIVDDAYESASDEFEFGKRERAALERRLDGAGCEGWRGMVCLFFFLSFFFQC